MMLHREQHTLSILGPIFYRVCSGVLSHWGACDLIRVISISWQCTTSTLLQMFLMKID